MTLGIEMSESEFELFWNTADQDRTGEISEDEALMLLRGLLFFSAETANRILYFLENGIDGVQHSLMTGRFDDVKLRTASCWNANRLCIYPDSYSLFQMYPPALLPPPQLAM